MISTRLSLGSSLIAAALALSACGGETTDTPAGDGEITAEAPANVPATPQMATASLKTADGADVGTVTATARGQDIVIAVTAAGMTAGDHGIHVHTTGKCEGPKFESAGAHWNPGGAKHGLSNPQGQHHGDMPNLTIATDGSSQMDYTIKGTSIAELLDADGAALVIHAKPDDQMTDPSGNSGDRIACGVFTTGT
jgi:Cu-Zn family superoxide dismutase